MMRLLFTLINKELTEQWRTKKILILVVVMLFSAIASPIIAKLMPELLKSISIQGLTINLPESTYRDSIDQFIKNISQIGLLVVIFVVASAMTDEKSRRTLEIVMTKPIPRGLFIFSKFAAYFISISAIFALASWVFYNYTVMTFTTFSSLNFWIMSKCMLAYMLMVVSFTVLASTIFKNAIIAGGAGFVFFLSFGPLVGMIKAAKGFSPNVILSSYQEIIKNGWSDDLIKPLIIIFITVIFSIFLSMVVFKRQEIER